jgi:hypothetical protein
MLVNKTIQEHVLVNKTIRKHVLVNKTIREHVLVNKTCFRSTTLGLQIGRISKKTKFPTYFKRQVSRYTYGAHTLVTLPRIVTPYRDSVNGTRERITYQKLLYVFFWVIPRRLNFICRRFGTLYLFHLHRQEGE